MQRCRVWYPVALSAWCLGCAAAEEPARVQLRVMASPEGMAPVQTDLGYLVELSEARIVLDDLQFTVAGEASAASLWQRMTELVIPSALAHPGHFEGGDVTGELRGHFIVDLFAPDAAMLGVASLIVGKYSSSNFTFGEAGPGDGLTRGDALLGHTAVLVGEASQGGDNVSFSVVLDAPPGRQLIGAPFDVDISEASPDALSFGVLTLDPVEGDTLFDGIDFGALSTSSSGSNSGGALALQPDSADPLLAGAYDTLRRAFQTHDHFQLSATVAD